MSDTPHHWKRYPEQAARRAIQAAEWRRARRENPKIARLVYRRFMAAKQARIDSIMNAGTSNGATGLSKLLGELHP
jgi:phosphotransacetylase